MSARLSGTSSAPSTTRRWCGASTASGQPLAAPQTGESVKPVLKPVFVVYRSSYQSGSLPRPRATVKPVLKPVFVVYRSSHQSDSLPSHCKTSSKTGFCCVQEQLPVRQPAQTSVHRQTSTSQPEQRTFRQVSLRDKNVNRYLPVHSDNDHLDGNLILLSYF